MNALNLILFRLPLIVCASIFALATQAQIEFQNPSFEDGNAGVLGVGSSADSWPFCNGSTDWEPGAFNTQPAADGQHYLGFWDGGSSNFPNIPVPLGEGTMQLLVQNGQACPLITGKEYTFEFDLMSNPTSSYNPGHIAVVAGFAECQPSKLIWRSNQPGVNHTLGAGWQRYEITFTADQDYSWIGFYAISQGGGGDLQCSIDNLSTITKVDGSIDFTDATCGTLGTITYTPPPSGIGPYDYAWFEADRTTPIPGLSGSAVTGLNAGTYVLRVIDQSENCPVPSFFEVTISQNPPIEGSVTTDKTEICEGEEAQLDFVTNDTRTLIYSWSPTAGLSNPNIKNPIATPEADVTYTLTVQDPNDGSCTETYEIELDVTEVNPGEDAELDICEVDDAVDLFTILGGNPDANGTWTDPSGAAFTNPFNPAQDPAGEYTYTVSEGNCPPESAVITVVINTVPDAGADMAGSICQSETGFDLNTFLNGNPEEGSWAILPDQEAAGSVSTGGSYNAEAGEAGSYGVAYIVDAENGCPADTAILNLNVAASPEAELLEIEDVCEGSDYTINYTLDGDANNYEVYFRNNGLGNVQSGKTNGNQSFTVAYSTNLQVRLDSVVSNTAPFCAQDYTDQLQEANGLTSPLIAIDSVGCDVNSPDIIVYYKISGGEATSYQVAFDGGAFAPTSANAQENLDPGFHTMKVTDANLCEPIDSIAFTKACDCPTKPGTMQDVADTITICGTDAVSAAHNNDETLDFNDVKSFVLHTNPGQTPGTIIQSNASNATFSFMPGMSYGQVYYISAIVGDDDGSGKANPSAMNGCTQTAPGVPVIWYETPEGSVSITDTEMCEDQQIEFNFIFTAGTAPFAVSYEENGTAQSFTGLSSGDAAQLPNKVSGSYAYTNFTATDANGCTVSLANPTENTVVVNDEITAEVTSLDCAGDNQSYTVTVSLNLGTGNYLVDGTPITGSSFTSNSITNGNPVSFSFTDDKACNTIIIDTVKTCPCVTEAPAMAETGNTQFFCEDQTASVAVAGTQPNGEPAGFIGDANDTWSYVLSTSANDPIENRVAGSLRKTPDFDFSEFPGLSLGQTYYVCPIALDEDPSNPGLVDLTAPRCPLYTKPGTPIQWLALPTLSINAVESELCHAETPKIEFEIASPRAVAFDLDNGIDPVANITNQQEGTTIYDGVATTPIDALTAVAFSATNPSFATNTGQTCVGTWDGISADFNIHPVPTAAFNDDEYFICEGENLSKLQVAFTGGASNFATISPTLGEQQGSDGEAVDVLVTRFNLPAGTNTFTLENVYQEITTSAGGTKSCPGVAATPASVDIVSQALPNLDIALDKTEICLGETVTLDFDVDANGNQFTVFDANNTPYVINQQDDSTFAPTQDTTFVFTRIEQPTISDESGNACGRDVNERVSLKVNSLPLGLIYDLDDEICQGDSALIYFKIFGNGPFTVNFENTTDENPFQLDYENGADSASAWVTPSDSAEFILLNVRDANSCDSKRNDGQAYIPVNPNPVPEFEAVTPAACTPLVTQLNNTTPSNLVGSVLWEVEGTGLQSTDLVPTFTLEEIGDYDVSLTVTSPQTCVGKTTIPQFLTVNPYPVADFNIVGSPTVLNPQVQIMDYAALADNHQYFLDSNFVDRSAQPLLSLPGDTGTYSITQIVGTDAGCFDTLTQQVTVEDALFMHIPSAFTPDGDGNNDVFSPYHTGLAIEDAVLRIYNRWGEEIFTTEEKPWTWDGTFRGQDVSVGSYSFVFTYVVSDTGERQTQRGVVTLLR